jgi:O-antigen/teichoic acid export membrane protein
MKLRTPSMSKAIDLVLSQVVPFALAAITTFATAGILGTADRGRLALILSTGGLIGAIGFLSLHVGIVHATVRGDRTATRRGWSVGASIAIAVLVVGVVGGFFIPLSADSATLYGRYTVVFAAIGGALVLFNLVVLRTRQGLGASRTFRNAWFIQSAVFPLIGLPVAVITHDPYAVAVCWFIALVASTIYAAFRTGHEVNAAEPLHVPTRSIVATALASHVAVLGQQLLFRGDIVVLGFFVSAQQLGIYSVAAPIAGMIWVFSEALSLLAFDTGGKVQTAEEARSRRRRLVAINAIVGGIGAVIVGLLSWLLIPLFLPAYVDAIPLILILLPGVVVQGYARITLSSVLTSGDRRAPLWIGVGSALLSVVYIPLSALLGIVGAAIASTIIYALQSVLVAIVVRRARKNGSTQIV